MGVAFANALARQSEGHTNRLAVLTPNLAVKPATVHDHEGNDQGHEAGRADVRARPGCRGQRPWPDSVAYKVIPADPGRKPGDRLRRVHPPGRRSRQEDLTTSTTKPPSWRSRSATHRKPTAKGNAGRQGQRRPIRSAASNPAPKGAPLARSTARAPDQPPKPPSAAKAPVGGWSADG